jgi:NADH:ubiquinone oxidoreductase subunit 6 (subunit J)
LFLSHPIYALIVLIGIFLNAAFFLFHQHIQFIALIYIIIYIGAISILFLFVLMMFNLKKLKTPSQIYLHTIPSFLSFCTLGIISYLITATEIRSSSNANFLFYIGDKALDAKQYITYHNSDILLFSHLFYTYYNYLFLLSGFLLFIAMIGAIVLALGITEKTLAKPEPKTYLKYYHFITKHEN